MDKKALIKNIKYLISNIEGCPDPDCLVFKRHNRKIKEIAKQLDINVDELMPAWLKSKEGDKS